MSLEPRTRKSRVGRWKIWTRRMSDVEEVRHSPTGASPTDPALQNMPCQHC